MFLALVGHNSKPEGFTEGWDRTVESSKTSSFPRRLCGGVEHMEALVTVPVGKVCFLVKEDPMGNDVSKLLEHVQCVSSRGNHARKDRLRKTFPCNASLSFELKVTKQKEATRTIYCHFSIQWNLCLTYLDGFLKKKIIDTFYIRL